MVRLCIVLAAKPTHVDRQAVGKYDVSVARANDCSPT
jgi:hypothetical protein